MKKTGNNSEACPNCKNTENNFMLGSGHSMIIYYHCSCCGHDFAIDASVYINSSKSKEQMTVPNEL